MTVPTDDHPATTDPDRLLGECDVQRTRRSGPGGQNRNKVETAVVLLHRSTGIRAEANERRSQAENLKVALFRLRLNLALSIRRSRENVKGPSALWSRRCRNGRIDVSATHDDFPSLIAEALDMLEVHGMEVPPAALALECTGSQLIKFLKDEPRAMQLVNTHRQSKGLRPLL